MKPSKLQHRVTRARVNGSKLLGLGWFWWPLWIRRVLVQAQEGQLAGAKAPAVFFGARPAARGQEGQLKAPHRISPVAALSLLRLMAEQSSRTVAYPLRSSRQVCMMIII
jgi:hypothetical protein